jgi:hypothetical protein
MNDSTLVEYRQTGAWHVAMRSDGTIDIYSGYIVLKNKRFWLAPNMSASALPDLPKHVERAVYSLRDKHRIRLSLIYRAGTYGVWAKPRWMASYHRYRTCKWAGLPYKPWSKEGRRVL